MSDVKRMSIKEFREFGFLQEANRLFFHPLGLALEVVVDTETGEERLGGVWDYRDDPEGLIYGDGVDVLKAQHVEQLRKDKSTSRRRLLGFEIEPVTQTATIRSGWKKYFTLTYWRIQFAMMIGIGRLVNIVSVARIELPDEDKPDA